MNGFTQDQLASLKALGFEGNAEIVCNANKDTIQAVITTRNHWGRKYLLPQNRGVNYRYQAYGDVCEYFLDFERLITYLS
jgi:hypothetical protein